MIVLSLTYNFKFEFQISKALFVKQNFDQSNKSPRLSSLLANLLRSVQIRTDIAGFVENKLVVDTVLKLKLVEYKVLKKMAFN